TGERIQALGIGKGDEIFVVADEIQYQEWENNDGTKGRKTVIIMKDFWIPSRKKTDSNVETARAAMGGGEVIGTEPMDIDPPEPEGEYSDMDDIANDIPF